MDGNKKQYDDYSYNELCCLVENLSDLCRICLKNGEHSIFHSHCDEVPLSDLLLKCTSIKVDESDKMPANICLQCITDLIQAVSFATRCQQSDEILSNILIAHEIKSNEHKALEQSIWNDHTYMQMLVTDDVEVKNLSLGINHDTPEHQNYETQENNITNSRLNNRKCTHCGKEFIKLIDLYRHRKLEHFGAIQKFCFECNEEFEKPSEYKLHRRKFHMNFYKLGVCFICGKSCKMGQLNKHVKSHTLNVCEFCGKTFTMFSNLKRHISSSHSDTKQFVCEYCGKSYSRKANLKEHYSLHQTNEMSLDSLQRLSSNTSENNRNDVRQAKFVCDLCGKQFISATGHYNHRKTHFDKQFECNFCSQKFHLKSKLILHIAKHTGKKFCKCKVCGKEFRLYSYLKNHNLIHLGVKPFKCDLCSKEFRQKTHFERHKLLHTGIKSHECEFCNKKFSLKFSLKVHLRTHIGEVSYFCDVCHKSYIDFDSHNCNKRTECA